MCGGRPVFFVAEVLNFVDKVEENWGAEEKEILRQLIAESAHILENKSTKTNANVLKTKTWRMVTNKLNVLTGKSRSEVELKLAWKRMKLAAKANLSFHNKELYKTGGGQKPPSPSPDDLEVMAIAPLDFLVERNDYDSDAVNTMPTSVCPESNRKQFSVKIPEAPSESTDKEQQVISSNENENPEIIILYNDDIEEKKGKRISKKRTEDGRNAIINSNVEFKTRHLEMMKVEHKLTVKKLNLEIAILQNRLNKECGSTTEK